MKKIIDEYNNIKKPEELYNFLCDKISYGYKGNDNKLYLPSDKDFNKVWYEKYTLQNENDILKNKVGNCYDLTELERTWFIKNNYEIETYFLIVGTNKKNNYPTHSFLTYKDNDEWCLFEVSDEKSRGILKFKDMHELLKYKLNIYINDLNLLGIKEEDKEKIILKEFTKPIEHISAKEYIESILK